MHTETLEQRFEKARTAARNLSNFELGHRVRTGLADVHEMTEAGKRLIALHEKEEAAS